MTETDYRDTVFLPRTGFPMRGDLPQREPTILARWEAMGLDSRLDAAGAGRPSFTLHDGPPYANGHLHIGHALNKILKDVVNRARRMSGYAVHYVPGWDCHGLPIEWKIEEEYRKSGRDKDQVPVLQFRAECRAYAAKWLEIQAGEFRRLGIQGDWAGRYATMDFASEAAIVGEIGRFLEAGTLYRGLRPVMWSPVERTALAEAEIEYHDHTSTTIWVAFPVTCDPTPARVLAGASAVIWTTTPWTIPANRAIAYGPEINYAVLEVEAAAEGSAVRPGARLLVAAALADAFAATAGILRYRVLHTLPGSALAGAMCAHPWRGVAGYAGGYDHDVPMLAGGFVTTEAGTGLVHMAPAHGEDDFALCVAAGIPVAEAVEGDGRYAAWVPGFAGLHVFKAAEPVCAALAAVMAASTGKTAVGLVARGQLVHSYPHSWRSRAPVIFRATPQWFIRMDAPEGGIRARALAALRDVAFVPAQARRRLTAMVAGRPDWCISRQRAWGVPIAVFVERRTGAALRDPDVTARVVEAFRAEGADAWYGSAPERFLGEGRDPADYEQVFDIVDVWFESGSTHAFVLGPHNPAGLPFPADLYLEGSDQHRGWFQSCLLESVGTRGIAPFGRWSPTASCWTRPGRKMSKSLGNVTAPQEVSDTLGADILRLWVMNSDTDQDLRIGKEILQPAGRALSPAAQHAALAAGGAGRLRRGRAPAGGGDAGAGALGAAPAGRARRAGRARGADARVGRRVCRRCMRSAPPTCRRSTSTCARTRSIATRPRARAAAPPAPCSTCCTGRSPAGWRRCWYSPPRRPGRRGSATPTACTCRRFPRSRRSGTTRRWASAGPVCARCDGLSPPRSRRRGGTASSAPRCRRRWS